MHAFVKSKEQLADVLSKGFSNRVFDFIVNKLGSVKLRILLGFAAIVRIFIPDVS